jgi:hypothetical protein
MRIWREGGGSACVAGRREKRGTKPIVGWAENERVAAELGLRRGGAETQRSARSLERLRGVRIWREGGGAACVAGRGEKRGTKPIVGWAENERVAGDLRLRRGDAEIGAEFGDIEGIR